MFNKKPKTKELLSGVDLYNKLTYNRKGSAPSSVIQLLSHVDAELQIDKHQFYMHKTSHQSILEYWECVFLGANEEAGLLRTWTTRIPAKNKHISVYLGYFSNNTLHLKENIVKFNFDKKTAKIIKEYRSYSLYFDEVYVPKKKIEKINSDMEKRVLRSFAKQLIRQKIKKQYLF